jgi:nucleoid-associated protein YgaU
MNPNTTFVSHSVKPEDTLDSLALTYYNNPTYWWVIAYFNKINNPFIRLSEKFSILKIPAISSIEFSNER